MIRTTRVKDHPMPMDWPEMALAHEHCRGVGIELGAAANNRFHLPGSINVSPWDDDATQFDYHDYLFNRDYQIATCGSYAEVDRKGEADAIPVEDHSQDYVISSHVIEHVPDAISAFLEWKRVLRAGGTIFMIFPKRDAAPLDADRPLTELQEFIDDYREKRNVVTHPTPAGHSTRGHYHVFSLASMLALIAWCNEHVDLGWEVVATEETDTKVGNGHTVVSRQLAAVPSPGRGKRWLDSGIAPTLWRRMTGRRSTSPEPRTGSEPASNVGDGGRSPAGRPAPQHATGGPRDRG